MIKLIQGKGSGFALTGFIVVIAMIVIPAAVFALFRARANARHERWVTGIRASNMMDPNCVLFFTFERGSLDIPDRKVRNLAYAFAGDIYHCPQKLDGTIVGNPQTVEGRFPGKIALEFDGLNDYVHVSDNVFLRPDYISLLVWFKVEDAEVGQIVAAKREKASPSSLGLVFWIHAYRVFFRVWNTDRIMAEPTATISSDRWYHAAGTFDGSKVRLFLNGELKDERDLSGTIGWTADPLTIGAQWAEWADRVLDGHFNGVICEVAIFNRALSTDEIKAHFEGSRP